MPDTFKNSYKTTEKSMVSLSVYNVGFQRCEPLYQWGPGIRDHYLIHHVVAGKGYYTVGGQTFTLSAGDTFLVYPLTEITYHADQNEPWEYYWVGFSGSDAAAIIGATGFSKEKPVLLGKQPTYKKLSSADLRGKRTGFFPCRENDRAFILNAVSVFKAVRYSRQKRRRAHLCSKCNYIYELSLSI